VIVADDTGCSWMVEVVGVGLHWRWVDATFGPGSAPASTPIGKRCQWCTVTQRASPALCWYAVERWHAFSWRIRVSAKDSLFPTKRWLSPPLLLRLRLLRVPRPNLVHGFGKARRRPEHLILARVPSGVIDTGHLRWFGLNWCLSRFGWNPLLWWTL
jgi:hypothetical protein